MESGDCHQIEQRAVVSINMVGAAKWFTDFALVGAVAPSRIIDSTKWQLDNVGARVRACVNVSICCLLAY